MSRAKGPGCFDSWARGLGLRGDGQVPPRLRLAHEAEGEERRPRHLRRAHRAAARQVWLQVDGDDVALSLLLSLLSLLSLLLLSLSLLLLL